MNHQAITDNWTKQVVVDLGLCPFAWQSIQENKLAKKVILDTELPKILSGLMDQILWLEENPHVESALVTVPNAFPTFLEFLDALDMATELLEKSGFEGVYQLATFHPEYQFAGTDLDDPGNYTNRSPFPIFHLIREEALSLAIDGHPDIDSIPNNNIKKMNALGIEHLRTLFNNCFNID